MDSLRSVYVAAFVPGELSLSMIHLPVNSMLPISPVYLLYYLPLLVAISLVYGATRHENMQQILRHAAHTAYWITCFMGVIFLILLVLGYVV